MKLKIKKPKNTKVYIKIKQKTPKIKKKYKQNKNLKRTFV